MSTNRKIFVTIGVLLLLSAVAFVTYYVLAIYTRGVPESSIQKDTLTQPQIAATTATQTSGTPAIGPKDTVLNMMNDFGQIMVDNPTAQQDSEVILRSPSFDQFLNKYMTADSVKEFKALPDFEKKMFIAFGLLAVFGKDSDPKEIISGNTATVSYKVRTNFEKGPIYNYCTLDMVIVDGSWKWQRGPFSADHVICAPVGAVQ